ncbi:MAG: NAD(P)/FAD-dependent oxidoreductase, partial [Marinilabiliaceae bacterium]|nr:NAD(P)/FAD-dependent oxidoreductase [Marinilabiliaceae bacterium]
MKYDVIVVGGGLGGLTAGAKLALSGKKVLLLEQHDRPGGCATTFQRGEFTMEVGLHEMDGLHERDMKLKIFRDLGIMEKVEFLPVPEFYRFINGRRDIVIPHNPDEAKNILYQNFPEQKKGVDAYFESVLNARKIASQAAGVPDRSVGDWLDEIITDEDLKLVLLGNLGYFHDDPYSLSYYYYLNAQGSYYNGRANFIKGGSQKLSDALADTITENGGHVKLKNRVSLVEPGHPNRVHYHTSGKKDSVFEAEAEIVIVNASLPELAGCLLKDKYGRALTESIESINIGASLLTVYFGFNRELSEFGCTNYSTFVYDESVKTQADILGNNKSDFDTRSFTFVDYGKVDSALAPEGKSVGAVCCIDYLSDWAGLDRKGYREKKCLAGMQISERLNKLFPGFEEAVDYMEVATAKTVKRYTLNPEGAVYGFAQNPGASRKYLDLLPENIYLASAWGKFGGGFTGAIFSGYMTALDII